ncbi:MAG TPA: hypothetical protein VND64_12070 [Pirellulales bacterium]|nr:hypothetical protein [Pirellulales bacterium]
MSDDTSPKHLIVLVADKNMELAVRGLLDRTGALALQMIEADIYVHPLRDPGCLRRSPDFLRDFHKQYVHALVMFDREGCGDRGVGRDELELDVERRLSDAGWIGRAAAVVLEPELEAWVWSDSPEVDQVLGWVGVQPNLRSWLEDEGFVKPGEMKPVRPKEAVERALRRSRKRRSSSIYFELARRVSVQRCTDPAFEKLKATLQRWFPASPAKA